MRAQIETSISCLRAFISSKEIGECAVVERSEVVAHATLSAFAHHWPSQIDSQILDLLERSPEIKEREHSRWLTQRRIALAKLLKARDAAGGEEVLGRGEECQKAGGD